MMEFPLTLNHILERAGDLFAKSEIVSQTPEKALHRYSYREFYSRSIQLAEALQQAGLQRGDRVATLMWNHYAHLEAYFGIPAAGGVYHTLNIRLHPDEIAYIANHASDRFLIVDDVLVPLLEKFIDKVSFERIFVVPLSQHPIPTRYEDYEMFLATAAGEFQFPELNENEPAGMCYTSGTTGRPKGVVYSHRSLVLHSLAAALVDTLAIGERDAVCPVVPMFHANAWGVPFASVLVGAKQVFPGPHLDAQSLLNLFAAENVTFAAGVPTIWLGIAQALEQNREGWLLKNIRMAVGGSAAPEGLIRTFDKFGLKVIHAWGMTETTPLATVSQPLALMDEWDANDVYRIRAKQGSRVPFIDMRIVNEDGIVPRDGQTMGELQVRGPWVARDYYNRPDTAASFTEDGWFRTGDVATIDEYGYMKITDRTKDLIKSGGEWISSLDLENTLMGHPGVAEAAVFAIPHPKWQERPVAAVVVKQGQTVSEEELKEYLTRTVPKWWVPEAFVFIDEIPRTSAGKFLKSKLRADYHDWNWNWDPAGKA
ncbi:long-chain fatty acid--CoA ligase [Alicyclobacillus sp. SO9]|uniref:long-chain fatty acid--CoA ligase n=1 Tax=Alicyclobacillus sp. SO9 TaxID=2665646 RepID=UPI0018E6FF17|nr:long-chain fatty acid--CoA ligase [Alicyclobacillus sp. SO9]QQE81136.1 long-chain fatty acid--CoA ligase [Alicyclobacillus sp. SO9]